MGKSILVVTAVPLITVAVAAVACAAEGQTGTATRPTVERSSSASPGQAAPYHGLNALARRNAWRPPERFKRGDAYLSERVIYTDTVTGREVWQMTVHPGVDRVVYYDLPEWNADGSLLAFVTDRSPQELWIMNGNGGRLRPMPVGQLPLEAVRQGYWSIREGNIWFFCQSDDQGSQVLELDVRNGTSRVVARTARSHLRLQPPHPLEKHFLLARQDRGGGDCEVVVLGRDGSEQVVPIGGRFHRLRFTKADNRMVFFNRDDPRTQWVIMPDGSGRKQLPDAGVHPDWTWDGSELTYFFDGGVFAMTPEGQRRRVFRTGSGGHGGPSLDGRFFIADQSGGDYPNSIVVATMDGSGRVWPVAYHGSRMWSHAAESQLSTGSGCPGLSRGLE